MPNECPICQTKELAQVQHDLNECKKRGQAKDRQIKKLNKQVFILTMVAIGIGAILARRHWTRSLSGSVRSSRSSLVFRISAGLSSPLRGL